MVVAALGALSGFCGEARMSGAGGLVIRDAEVEFFVRCYLPGWAPCDTRAAGSPQTSGVMPVTLSLKDATARGEASFVPTGDGRISARWVFTVDRPTKIEQFLVGTALPLEAYEGGAWTVNGKEFAFPVRGSKFQFGHSGGVRTLGLKDSTGKVRCTLRFDRPANIFFQDNKPFNGGFELRITGGDQVLEPGRLYPFGFSVETPEALAFVVPEPVVLKAGKDWLPFRSETGVRAGSALDFSLICGLDAPAGKYGRVVSRDRHFEFERRPGVPQRFYGVNLCFSANFHQTREEAFGFARMLARLGYNAVRIHHHDGTLVEGGQDSTTLNQDRLRELDALVAACVENGIYVTTDLYVSRKVPYREVGIDRDGTVEMQEFKDIVRTNAAAQANLKRFAKSWLTHVNDYTGRRWADEPGIAWISLVNENCPDNSRRVPSERMADVIAAESRFFGILREFVRKEIGSSVLLTDLNGWSCNPLWAPCREDFDYVDMHFYVDHPRFIERPWRLPSECGNSNPLRGKEPRGVVAAGRCKMGGKPFTITEWNFSGPGRFRGVGGIVTGAWAAQQDWDGLWRFAWSHDIGGVRNPEKKAMDYFNLCGDPLMLASERATMCLFLRRDLAAGDDKAFKIDGRHGAMTIDTPLTCGVFAEGGRMEAGALSVDIGDVPATVWVSSLDSKPIGKSDRLLLTHLTDVQNTGATYADDSLRVLKAWGGLPHLMRAGRADVSLCLEPGRFRVFVLNADGSRRDELPCSHVDGRLRFLAEIGRDPSAASYLYEIIRP